MDQLNNIKAKILIIDDTVSIINMVKTALLSKNYQVLIATSGKSGIISAEKALPDLILLDILMPEMDGYETCKLLKKNPITKDIPVLFMSALTEVFDKVKAFDIGAVDYVTKPLNVDELLARVNTQISLYKIQQKLGQTNQWLEQKVEERTQELQQNNKELITQHTALQTAEEELKKRFEELQAAEEELKASNDGLKLLNEELNDRNKELVHAKDEAFEKHEQLKALMDNIPDTIYFKDTKSRFIRNNQAHLEELGVEKQEDLDFKSDFDFYDIELAQNTYKDEQEIIKTGIPIINKTENGIHQTSGKEMWVSTTKVPIYDNKNQIKGIVGVTRDISPLIEAKNEFKENFEALQVAEEKLHASNDALKEVNKQLIESKQRFSLLSDLNLEGIIIHFEGVVFDTNQALCNILGITREEAIDKNIIPKHIHPDDIKIVHHNIKKGSVKPYRVRALKKDGTPIWIELEARNIIYKNKPARTTAIRDITEKINQDEVAKKLTQRLEAGLKAGNLAWWELELPSGDIAYDDNKVQMIGYDRKDFKGHPDFTKLIHPDDYDNAIKKVREHIEEKTPNYKVEYRLKTKNNQYKWFYDTASIVSRTKDGMLKIVGITEDINNRKKAELALERSNQSLIKLLNTTSGTSGQEYYNEIAKVIEETTEATYSFIAKRTARNEIQTFALYKNNELIENITYNIENAPCFHVIKNKTCIYPKDIKKLFPKYQLLNDMGIESYIGAPLLNHKNECIGLIASLYEKPMPNLAEFQSLFEIFASKIAGEMERKKAEEQLIISNDKIESIIRVAPTGIGIVKNRVISEINPKALGILGYSKQEILGKSAKMLYPTLNEFERVGKEKYEQITKNGTGIVETQWIKKDGGIIDIILASTPIDLNDLSKGVTFTVLDITKRKKTELNLLANEKQLQLIFDNSPAIMMVLDDKANIINVNKTGLLFTGNSHNDVINKKPGDIFKCITAIPNHKGCGHSQICEECIFKNTILQNIHTGKSINKIEANLSVFKNGQIEELTVLVSSTIATTGNTKTYLVTIDDITKRKKAELAVKANEVRFRTIIESANDAIFIADTKSGIIIDVNPKAEELLGKQKNKIIGKHHTILHPKNDFQISIDQFKNDIQNTNTTKTKEVYLQHSSGEMIPTELNPTLIKLDDNKEYIVGFFRDIRMRKQAEMALTESEYRFKQLANFTLEGIIIHNNGIVIDVNKALLQLSGHTQEEVLGGNAFDLFIPKEYQKQVIDNMMAGIEKPYEIEAKKKNGQTIPVQILTKNISTKDENLRVVAIRDITEQRNIQQKILNTIIQTEENERRRVAQELHDGIGPVLSTVKLYTQTYITTKNEEFKQKIEDQLIAGIDDALLQVSTISNNLSPHVLQDFGLKVAVQKFISRVSKIRSIEIEFDFNDDNQISKQIETTLYRVAIELINNTIKHANATLITLTFDKVNDLIQFVYTDNGIGFDLTETKKRNAGMGLFNIINRIESFKGRVSFERGVENGIAFNILIPAEL